MSVRINVLLRSVLKMADPLLFQKPYVLMQVFDDDNDIDHQPLIRVGLSSFQHFDNHVLLCSALFCSSMKPSFYTY